MHPPRIAGFSYDGSHRYLLTFTAFRRSRFFCTPQIVEDLLVQFRHSASVEQFEMLAHCFMPDHVHLLVAGIAETACLRRFVTRAKQQTGYRFAASTGQRLWQVGFYDHVLRDDEETIAVVRYILANPIRGGLTMAIGEYPFAGSDVFSTEEICECLQTWSGVSGRSWQR